MNTANLLWGVLFGAIGFAYFLYGRKQHRTPPLICGLALMGFPYFVDNTIALAAIGLTLCVAPYFFRY
jgi:hypothetical protein